MYDKRQIKENIERIIKEINGRAALLAATKTVPPEIINFAADCGITLIGENRVQELLEKYDKIDRDRLDIHFIGHLQRNKVKYIIDKVSLIHSVDSLALAQTIDQYAYRAGKRMDVLVEVNIGNEPSKYGIQFEEIDELIEKISALENIRVRGLMAIPPVCENSQENIVFFKKLSKKFIDIFGKKVDNSNIGILSIGMSNDYLQAIECGSTLVRIGSAIFGPRDYSKV
ncbi:MAG TPA: YggS family pyridoxal phosphate-dependent enzyme [Bacillota bacterium]|nr:YggS family pyridoxal phosphate-dependent enzyme [Bacillota bacterium]HOK69582.1 YggS family pyridoxal phosphate-dependent enzyme [Bacillota bacterium]HPP85028.1 YggS family pyridoxal phosphate-dependent enzyme [Bacillota bacterium]